MLYQLTISINLALRNWPHIILRATILVTIKIIAIEFLLIINTLDRIFPFAPTIQISKTKILKSKFYTTLMADNLTQLFLCEIRTLHIFYLGHSDTLTHLINIFSDISL